MEAVMLLEQKVVRLIERVRQLSKENTELAQENANLAQQCNSITNWAGTEQEQVKVLVQEKEHANALINSIAQQIDSILESTG